NEVFDGTTATGNLHNGTILYDADIEPDADHDGYGDVTQDKCASDASTQGACSPAPPAGTAPAITGFKAAPAKFRVKDGGAVVSRRRSHQGTKLKLTLSDPASVAFKVEKCKRPRGKGKGKGCAHPVVVHTFKRDLRQGASSLPYSGRYRRGGKPPFLKPGSYRVSAAPTGATGKVGATAQARF